MDTTIMFSILELAYLHVLVQLSDPCSPQTPVFCANFCTGSPTISHVGVTKSFTRYGPDRVARYVKLFVNKPCFRYRQSVFNKVKSCSQLSNSSKNGSVGHIGFHKREPKTPMACTMVMPGISVFSCFFSCTNIMLDIHQSKDMHIEVVIINYLPKIPSLSQFSADVLYTDHPHGSASGRRGPSYLLARRVHHPLLAKWREILEAL